MLVEPGLTESVAFGATPMTVGVSVASYRSSVILFELSGSLNGFSGIRPLYGLSPNLFTHLLRISPASMPNWYDPLNSLVTQNGPVHQNRNFPGMLPIRVWNTKTSLSMPNPSSLPCLFLSINAFCRLCSSSNCSRLAFRCSSSSHNVSSQILSDCISLKCSRT